MGAARWAACGWSGVSDKAVAEFYKDRQVWWTGRARLTMDAIKDQRYQSWELEDVELAITLGRETLPWTYDYGYVLMVTMAAAWAQQKGYIQ